MKDLRRHLGSRDAAYALLLLGAAFAYFAPLFLFHQVFHGRDHGELNLPLQMWMHGRLQQGLPLAWMQSVACGEPVQDALTTPTYYPPLALLLRLCGPLLAYDLHAVLHAFWAALGCYLWARQRGASPEGSLLGALAGGFAGGLAFCLPWWTVLITLAWLPWGCLGLELCLGSARLRWGGAALLGLSLGLGFSGGYPGMVFYAVLPLGLRALQGLWEHPHRWKALAAMAAGAVLSLLIAAGALAGVGRLSAGSLRGSALSFEAASENSMSPAAFPQLLAPHALGRIADDSYLGVSWRFGSYDPHGLILYLGLAGLMLAWLGLRARPGRHWPALVAMAGIVLYALGSFTPAYAFLIKLPVLSHLRAPMKAGVLVALLCCVPVAEGYDQLRAHGARRPGRVLLVLGALLLLGGALLWAAQDLLLEAGRHYIGQRIVSDPIHQRSAAHYIAKLGRWALGLQRHLAFQGAVGLLAGWLLLRIAKGAGRAAALALAALLLADLAVNGNAGYSRVDQALYAQPPQTLAWLQQRDPDAWAGRSQHPWRVLAWGRNAHLLSAFPEGRRDGDLAGERVNMELPPGNMAAYWGFDQFNAYSPAQVGRSQLLYGWSRDDRAGVDTAEQTAELLRRRRVLDLAGVRYILSSVPLRAPELELIHPGQPAIYQNKRALPLAYLASQVARVSGPDEALRRLTDAQDPVQGWERPALVEDAGAWANGEGELKFDAYDDSRWSLSVDVEQPGGTLVLARTFYRGLFKAYDNGREVELVPANLGFCALRLGAGHHDVEVRVDEARAAQEARPYWGGLLLCAALAAYAYSRSRQAHA